MLFIAVPYILFKENNADVMVSETSETEPSP